MRPTSLPTTGCEMDRQFQSDEAVDVFVARGGSPGLSQGAMEKPAGTHNACAQSTLRHDKAEYRVAIMQWLHERRIDYRTGEPLCKILTRSGADDFE